MSGWVGGERFVYEGFHGMAAIVEVPAPGWYTVTVIYGDVTLSVRVYVGPEALLRTDPPIAPAQ